jgi:hypothetical protein
MPAYFYLPERGQPILLGRIVFAGEGSEEAPAITVHVTRIPAEANAWADALHAGLAPDGPVYRDAHTAVPFDIATATSHDLG